MRITLTATIFGVFVALLLLGFIYERNSRSRADRRPIPGRLVDMEATVFMLPSVGAVGLRW